MRNEFCLWNYWFCVHHFSVCQRSITTNTHSILCSPEIYISFTLVLVRSPEVRNEVSYGARARWHWGLVGHDVIWHRAMRRHNQLCMTPHCAGCCQLTVLKKWERLSCTNPEQRAGQNAPRKPQMHGTADGAVRRGIVFTGLWGSTEQA